MTERPEVPMTATIDPTVTVGALGSWHTHLLVYEGNSRLAPSALDAERAAAGR